MNLTGHRYGKLTVKEYAGRNKFNHPLWKCICDCGKECVSNAYSMRNGGTRSCGCGIAEVTIRMNTTHGSTGTPLYIRWMGIKNRCYCENHESYKHYGGRGIKMCDEWKESFEAFRFDMGAGFNPSLEIDRIDVNGDYCKENCRWVTRKVQARNQRRNVLLTYMGKTKCLSDWAIELGVKPNTLTHRIKRGWPVDRVLGELPKKRRYRNR